MFILNIILVILNGFLTGVVMAQGQMFTGILWGVSTLLLAACMIYLQWIEKRLESAEAEAKHTKRTMGMQGY